MTEKVCRDCGKLQAIECFYSNARHGKGEERAAWWSSYCKPCHNVRVSAARHRRQQGPTRDSDLQRNRNWQRHRKLRSMGVPEADIPRIDQEALTGCCYACGREASSVPRTGRLHFDHNHETGQFRGLLCQLCNIALGHVREDPQILRGLLAYLTRQPVELHLESA